MSRAIPPYLRLVPKPLAKCGAAPYPRQRLPGFEVTRAGRRRWWLSYSRNGHQTDLWITRDELADLAEQATALLARDREDT